MVHRYLNVCIALILLALFAVTAIAAPATANSAKRFTKEQLNSIAERMLNGESVTPSEKEAAYPLFVDRLREQEGQNVSVVDLAGGPDAFGYRFLDDREAGGPVFSWITPTASATNITFSGDDSNFGPFTMAGGFTFPFYGTNYSQFYMSTNGTLTFGSGYYNYSPGPYTSGPAGIYYAGGDMYVTSGTTVIKQELLTSPARLLIDISNLQNYSPRTNLHQFQIILYASGEVVIQCNGTMPSATYPNYVGIQNQNAVSSLYYVNTNANYTTNMAAGRAIKFFTLGQPSSPIPADGAMNSPTNTVFRWTAAAAANSYNLLWGTTNPPTTSVTGLTEPVYDPGPLAASTLYYWQVIASNGAATNAGPVWSFTTGAGAAPDAPTNGQIVSVGTTTLQGSFTDNSTNETGFPLEWSTNGVNYTAVTTLPAHTGTGTVTVDGTGLTPSTQNWFRVFATGAGGTSTGYAEANTWTLASTPDPISGAASGLSTVTFTVNNNAAVPNPANVNYSIYESTTGQYVQANGALGASAAWQTLTQWGATTTVRSLNPNTTYTFQVKARNGASVETALSTGINVPTINLNQTFVQDFSEGIVPPTGWTVEQNPVDSYTWIYNAAGLGNAGSARINFWSYSASNARDYLWSPSVTTAGIMEGVVAFDWYYHPGYSTSYDDTVLVVYSLDGGVTVAGTMWLRHGFGAGAENLSEGCTGGSVSSVGTTWGHAEIPLPAGALNAANLKIGWLGITDYGPDIFVDNLGLYLGSPSGGAICGFTPSSVAFGEGAVGTIYQQTVAVNNPGTDALNITDVVAPTNYTVSWTTQTIPAGGSANITVTWSPTSAGASSGNIVFTSNALNNPASLPVSGNASAAVLQNATVTPSTFVETGQSVVYTVDVVSASAITVNFVDISINGATGVPMTAGAGTFPGTVTYSYTQSFATPGTTNYSFNLDYTFGGTAQFRLPTSGSIAGPTITIAQNGGPDGGGYFYRTSLAVGGPAFSWVDISATGTDVTFSGIDDAVSLIDLGTFSFPFYGSTVDATVGLIASTNGNLQIGATGSASFSNVALPTDALNAGAMAFMWDDNQIDASASQWVKYQNMNDGRFVVSYHMSHLSAPASTFDAQVIIYSNGRIVYQYTNVPLSTSMSGTLGIQGAQTGTMFTQFGGENEVPVNNWAIEFYTLPPLPPSDVTDLTISYSGGVASLSWSAVAGSPNGYYVYRSTNAYFTPVIGDRIATVGVTNYNEAVSGRFFYKVTSHNDASSDSYIPDPAYGSAWPRALGINRDARKTNR